MSDTLSSAKAALATANKKFPSAQAAAAGVKPAGARNTPTPTAKVAPPKAAADDTAAGLKAVQDNVKEYSKAQEPPKMHDGGTVPSTGVYTLQKGEIVVPVSNGRASDYRKVYLNRQTKTTDSKPQTRQGGGNSPAKGEAHEKESKKLPYKQAQE